MIDAIRWLVVLEVIGLACLPLTLWMCASLPDRGYGLSKTMGLVLLTFGSWIVGEALPVAVGVWLPLAMLLAGGIAAWWWFRDLVLACWREQQRVVLLEEGLFLLAFVAWCLMRAYVFHPGISHTEQYMDMSILGASVRSGSYPPYDPWMSGHGMNYYYLGYVMYSLVIKLSGVVTSVGYNLALSTIFALVAGASYSAGLALCRRLLGALTFPIAIVLLGNWHAAAIQLLGRDYAKSGYDVFFSATRVIGPDSTTITEFPLFSLMLGDLHPHVMALPVTLLAATLGLTFLFDLSALRLGRSFGAWARLAVTGVVVGSLFVMNSWDFPTYALLVVLCLAAAAYMNDPSPDWWKTPIVATGALGVVAVVAYAPFYVQYRAPAHGFGFVTTPSNPWEFLQVLGIFALPCALLIAAYSVLFQPAPEDEASEETRASAPITPAVEAGAARAADSPLLLAAVVALLVLVLGIRFHVWVLLGLLLGALFALMMLHRVLNTEDPNRSDAGALLLVLVGCLAAAIPETVYIRDGFDGSALYRMNTVFKFDYQAWVLLGLAAAYALSRVPSILKSVLRPAVAAGAGALIVLGGMAGAVYTFAAPASANWGGTAVGLDGSTALRDAPPQSGDYAAIMWLRDHASGAPVELEATGPAYQPDSARVSTFTGLPTVMGWADHENQWRGADPDIGTRVTDVNTIYTTHNVGLARTLLHKYHVKYVFVGSAEQALSHADLGKFDRFMRIAYRDSSAIVYTW